MDEQKINRAVLEAALAGLLHDVGKFAQRAGEQVSAEWSEGKTREEFKYQHALQSWHFINKYVPKTFGIGALAAYHHRPQNAAQKRIRLADQLSAGERASGQERDDSDPKIHPKQLHPIFTQVSADGQPHPLKGQEKFYFPLKALALKEAALFAQVEPTPEERVWEDYKEMWDAFCREAEALRNTPLELYAEGMLALMQRYTWCVPSAYFKTLPDVSLYDHSRMTAAMAVCLQELGDERIETLQEAWNKQEGKVLDEPVALLVGGDISGVQDFIYTISSKGAARMLRGRSFYLQLLTEATLRYVLRGLGLPYSNVIYSGGGHFYLLAPLSAKEKLPAIQSEVGRILLQQHGTQLYLVLGEASIPAKGFQMGQLSAYWQAMHNQLTNAKNRRYAELGNELYECVFKVPEYGGNPNDTCSVCGDDRRGAGNWDEWEAQSKICPLCRSFAETLGTDLPKTQFLALKFGEPQIGDEIAEKALDILSMFGMDVEFLKSVEDKVTVRADQHLVIWALDDPQNGKWLQTPKPVARWLKYTANRVPVVKDHAEADNINKRLGNVDEKEKAYLDQPMTFSHLNVLSASGFERLGVLRMDVDNLGSIFKDGLGESFSLSRMATLSFQISLFFEGWLKRIVEKQDWQSLVYTVYSGGDDLFLLAPWDKAPALAQKIMADFAAYTAHPGMHISGGMVFIDGKYPIYQAADDAAEAEALAKEDDKNAFGFLNRRWHWSDFHELTARKDDLKALVLGEIAGERGGPRSVLQTLRSLARMEEEAEKEKGRSVWGRWMWLGAYQLARMEERYKNNAALKEKIARLREKMGSFQYLETWGAAARWAQLETRKISSPSKEKEVKNE